MKKLVLFAVVAIAVSFASCGNKPTPEEIEKAKQDSIAKVDSLAKVEAEAAAAALQADSLAAAQAQADSLAAVKK